MFKVKMKILGGFRKIYAAEGFSKIRGFISTARKQDASVFGVLKSRGGSSLDPQRPRPGYGLETRL